MSISGSRRHALAVPLAVVALLLPSTGTAQQPRNDPGWPCKGTIDPAYIQVAEATGGVVMLFQPAEFAGAAAELRGSDRHHEVVFRATGQLAEGETEFDVPLDSTIESAFFFVSVQCPRAMTLIKPSGDELHVDEPGLEYHHFEAVRLFTLPQPAPGSWKVKIAGRGFFSVIVKAATELTLSDVTFSAGAPLKRERQRLAVEMNGAMSDVAFYFVSASAAAIERVALTLEEEDDDGRRYAGEVTPPAGDFRVAMTGIDGRGFRVQRVHPSLEIR
jgi:hypothetical protein